MQKHVYDTSYALSAGIEIRKLDEPVRLDFPKEMVRYRRPHVVHIIPSRWHTTKAEAIADAESLRKKKIASLEKQLAKLRAMTFDVPDLPKEN